MDYEKKYKDALEKARQLCAYPITKPFIGDLQDLFPELKKSEESGDEKIRKNLIELFHDTVSNDEIFSDYGLDKTEVLAWLEKQGSEPNWCHHKVDLSDCSEEYRKAYYDGWNNCNMQHSQCRSESNDVIKCLINGMKFYYEDNKEATWGTEKFSMKVKDILSWLEKQGEQKPVISNDALREGIAHFGITQHQIDNWLKKYVDVEKQGEQKSIDNLTQQEAMDIAVAKCFDEQKPADKVEPKFHEGEWITNGDYTWKIVEVKPLDYILQSQDGNIVDDTISYVDEQFHSFTIKDAKDGDVLATDDWVFIFKEIYSEKSINCYCHYDYDEDMQLFNVDTNYHMVTGGTIHPATKGQRDTLFSKMKEAGYEWDADKKELKMTEQKPFWGEEDEKMFDYALDMIEWYSDKNEDKSRLVSDWLKSIKDRVQPQSQWKPSEEQIEALNRAMYHVEDDVATQIAKLIGDLKKLRGE